MLVNDGAKLRFAYRLNHAAQNDSLEIGVAGADGCRYVKRITLAQQVNWRMAAKSSRCSTRNIRCRLETTALALEALKRVFGLDYWRGSRVPAEASLKAYECLDRWLKS